MSDYENRHTLDDVCERLDDIERAVNASEAATRANHFDLSGAIWGFLALVAVIAWVPDIWHSKIRYSFFYSVDYDQVTIEKEPKDCNFFHAPLGGKGCHYDRQITTVKVKSVYPGFPNQSVHYVSYDDGKTWTADTASPPTKPQVLVSWEKVEE